MGKRRLLSILFIIILSLYTGCSSDMKTIKVRSLDAETVKSTIFAGKKTNNYLIKGNEYFNQNQYDSALVCYHKAYALDKNNWLVLYQFGQVAYETDNYELADYYYSLALDNCGHDKQQRAVIYLAFAHNEFKQGNHGKAHLKYITALQLDPQSKEAISGLKKIRSLTKID